MTCNRCGKSMKITRGVHHNQRKWKCPNCGRVRMQMNRPKT